MKNGKAIFAVRLQSVDWALRIECVGKLQQIISALIIFGTWELLKDSFSLAIDGVPDRIDERAVRTYLLERPGVNGIHDLHIWSLSTVETALTAHLVMHQGHPGDEFLAEICLDLQQHFGIQHATLQIEIGNSDRSCLLESSCQF